MMSRLLIILVICFTALAAGCYNKPLPPPDRVVSEPLPTLPQEGQIPEQTLQDASARYGGSMTSQNANTPNTPYGQINGVVLGPIDLQDPAYGPNSTDAGNRIRSVVAQTLAQDPEMSLVDAPKERFLNDSPRPDLWNKGVVMVVKGTMSFNKASHTATVFLRAVNTQSGKVMAVGSGRSADPDKAATQAAGRLLNKLKGASP